MDGPSVDGNYESQLYLGSNDAFQIQDGFARKHGSDDVSPPFCLLKINESERRFVLVNMHVKLGILGKPDAIGIDVCVSAWIVEVKLHEMSIGPQG